MNKVIPMMIHSLIKIL